MCTTEVELRSYMTRKVVYHAPKPVPENPYVVIFELSNHLDLLRRLKQRLSVLSAFIREKIFFLDPK